MAKANINSRTEVAMTDNGETIKWMEKAIFSLRMKPYNIQGNGNQISTTDGDCLKLV
jgi:hypothetical protein